VPTPPALSPLRGVATILLTLASWTSIPLFLRHFAPLIDGWTANGWRYGISALLWLPPLILGWRRGSLPPGLWKAALIPSLFNTAAQVCFALAPYYVEPGLMTFSLRLQIVFVTCGAAILFPAERRVIRSRGFLLGLALVVLGTALTLALTPGGLGGGKPVGIALSIGAGLLYAAYALSVRRFMYGMRPLDAFAAVSQYTAVAIVAFMLIWGEDMGAGALALDPWQMVLLVISAVVGIGLGHTLYFISIGTLGLAVSAGVVQLQPITVSIASVFMFHERFTPQQWGTGLVAIAGAAVMLVAQHRMQKQAASTRH